METTVKRLDPILRLPGQVFMARGTDATCFVTDPLRGVKVFSDASPLDQLSVTGYFVMPVLPLHAGSYNILTVGRGRPGCGKKPAEFQDPVELATEKGGVFVTVAYDARQSRFYFHSNVGNETSELVSVWTGPAPREAVFGRVFQLYVEISEGRTFASVNETFAGGELCYDVVGGSSGGPRDPWGAPVTGNWFVALGLLETAGRRFLPFPPGFGFSDLQVAATAEADHEPMAMDYSGELDGLAGRIRPPQKISVPPTALTLMEQALQLRAVAGQLEEIARRTPA